MPAPTARRVFRYLPATMGLLMFLAIFPGRSIGAEETEKRPPKSEVKPLFEDKFDGQLAKEWSWMNENADAWRIGKEGLELHTLSAELKTLNVILGPEFKAGMKLAAEVHVEIQQSVQFEHAGLTCYFDRKNWVSINSEGEIVFTEHRDGKNHWQLFPNHKVEHAFWARLVVADGKAVAFYRIKPQDEWKKVAECELPGKGDFRFGLTAGAWPKGADDWARFRDFRVLPAEK